MKLLYITNGITGAGGLERVLSVKASMLAEDFGYEVHIISFNEPGKETFFEFDPRVIRHSITVTGNPFSYVKSYVRNIKKKITSIEPDIISVCDDGLKGFFLPRILKTEVPLIYERHVSKLIEARATQGFFQNMVTRSKWALMEKLGGDFSKFIVLTEGSKKEWKSLNNIEVIPNPLPFSRKPASSRQSKTVICVGKISYQKGQDLLLEIWNKIWKRYPDWKLELYGKSDGSFLDTVKLKEKNIYHYPPVKNIHDKYLESSVYVLPSRFEGFGMVLIEAMSCELPVVSFDCPHGPGDIITDGQDGFLIENGHIKSFADKLSQLMQNSDLRQKMGSAARETSKKYHPEKIASQWDRLFKSLLSQP